MTAAINLAHKSEQLQPEDTLKTITWRVPGRFTFWQGLEGEVQRYNLKKEILNLSHFSSEQKLLYLHFKFSQNQPIVLYIKLIGSSPYYRHFAMLLGYDDSLGEYYFYNSLVPAEKPSEVSSKNYSLTIDENGSKLGNRTLTKERLIQSWQEASIFGFYDYYALVINP